MNTLFDENGVLNLDELVENSASYRTIMEDGVVTDEELAEQANAVVALLQKIREDFTDEQQQTIKELLAEISVLYTAYHYKELQSINY